MGVNQSQGREETWGCSKDGVLLCPLVLMQNSEGQRTLNSNLGSQVIRKVL